MNYATIKYYDIANGPGVRTSVFVSGCRHHCPGCFNEVGWCFGYCQAFRQACDDAVAGRGLDPALLGQLEGLANRGYTDGFYQRHTPHETQNYLRGHSESGRSLYVGDVVAYDTARGLAEVATKNAFSVGDRLELIHPAGNSELQVERLLTPGGHEITRVPRSDHRVWLPLPPESVGAFVARFI